ncbi:leader peptidase (prepilin peptidase)/N-methyltransferase [Pseudomonas marginalis]|uniref:prepilin peptidase n=1 Tax=Pseudomonas marginalis TaxID=298 RepID=UPI00209D1190|nr:A24 family peptidase [Pseudomonas marginalis]MCP1504710.1 leader peptidase (prepilin peptidase)/N-methyltransferase [Pseudomonas marginalis]MCP1522214.1 leader peptidase (prepilin peptidase)/N-methyltransferase [Pseudomonas marginalis]MDQ0500982.1 leader peptidase (prepilin peptidase)/N-methyltransferase [Pseudomonas marginalis]
MNLLLSQQPWAFVVMALVLGLIVGSFLNVLVWRLPKMLEREWRAQAHEVLGLPGDPVGPRYNLMQPNSCCPHCNQPIRPWENIPLLSYLMLRGRCTHCREAISVRYPFTELACAVISAVVAWHFGFGWQAGAVMLLSWGLLAMSLIDVDHQLLPDVLVLPLLWLGLMLNSIGLLVPLPDALWGAVIGYMSLWTVFWLFKLATGKDGMGYGDFKLLALLGAWGGWQILPMTLLISSLVGVCGGLILLRRSKTQTSAPMPFGPYLAIAGWIAVLWGGQITDFYLQSVGFR